jgi:hypothetical protein
MPEMNGIGKRKQFIVHHHILKVDDTKRLKKSLHASEFIPCKSSGDESPRRVEM